MRVAAAHLDIEPAHFLLGAQKLAVQLGREELADGAALRVAEEDERLVGVDLLHHLKVAERLLVPTDERGLGKLELGLLLGATDRRSNLASQRDLEPPRALLGVRTAMGTGAPAPSVPFGILIMRRSIENNIFIFTVTTRISAASWHRSDKQRRG